MSGSPVTEFFFRFAMRRTRAADLDEVLAHSPATLDILFLWGRDCPNCENAKRAILAAPARFLWPDVRWLHDDVYDDGGMATRFGLHGIPVFFVFQRTRKIGRITAWPGTEAFIDTIDRQRKLCAPPSADPAVE